MIGQASIAHVRQATEFAGLDAAMARAQRYVVVTAALLIPLIVLPESQFLDFTSTPKGVALSMLGWVLLGVMAARVALRLLEPGAPIIAVAKEFFRSNRFSGAILVTAALAGALPLASYAASPFGSFPLWGREPGTGGGAIGALHYMALGLATFWSAREAGSVRPLVLAIAISATAAAAIGAAQYFGLSPFGISNTLTSQGRVTGTSGNPIFFGSLLVIALPIVLTVRPISSQSSITIRKLEAAGLAAVAVLFTVALVATVSRGPWLGAAAGLTATLGFILWLFGPRKAAVWSSMIAVPAAVTVLVMFAAPSLSGETTSGGDQGAGSDTPTVNSLDRVTNGRTVQTRLVYWSMAVDLSLHRPDVPLAEQRGWLPLFLFGYGPDSARYVMPLNAPADLFGAQFTTVHNDPLNRLLEQGAVGLLIWLTFWAALLAGLVHAARLANRTGSPIRSWLTAGLAGALAAWLVAQLSGVPKPGDQVFLWMIVGVLASLCVAPGATASSKEKSKIRLSIGRQAAFAGIAGSIAVLALVAAWDRGMDYLAASHEATAVSGQGVVQYDAAVGSLLRAVSMAPDVVEYRFLLADIYRNAGVDAANRTEQLELFWLAYAEAEAAFDANPFELDSNFRLAQAAWDLGQAGVPGKAQEAVGIYERLALLAPGHPVVAERLPALRAAVDASAP